MCAKLKPGAFSYTRSCNHFQASQPAVGPLGLLCSSCSSVSCWPWRRMEPGFQLEGMGQWLQCLLPWPALPVALSFSSIIWYLSAPTALEDRLLGNCRANLRLLLLDEALVLAQHRARGGVGALLEQGPRGCGVCSPGLRALQPRAPAALRSI